MAISDCVALDALRVGAGLKGIAFISSQVVATYKVSPSGELATVDEQFEFMTESLHWRLPQVARTAAYESARPGAIEGGITAIVVQRAKQSGMHWNVDGAADIIALRCQLASGRWDELWPARTAQPTGLRSAV
jgi:hypothetical protein